LLDVSISGARGILFVVAGSDDLGIMEVQEAAKVISESIDKNAWWQVDIGEVKDISSVTVIPYYKDPNRYYQFIVKTSINGKIWTTFFDMSDNTKPIGKEGANYTGQLTPVRYIRVEMLGNSANEGKHLVEVIAK